MIFSKFIILLFIKKNSSVLTALYLQHVCIGLLHFPNKAEIKAANTITVTIFMLEESPIKYLYTVYNREF